MRTLFIPGQLPDQGTGLWNSTDVSNFRNIDRAAKEIYEHCGQESDGAAGWIPVGE